MVSEQLRVFLRADHVSKLIPYNLGHLVHLAIQLSVAVGTQ